MSELVLVRPGPAPIPAVYPLVLTVDYDLNLCSPNRNAYGGGPDANRAALVAARVLSGRKEALRQRVRVAYASAGSPEWNVPVVVDVAVRRGDRVDEDNLRAALKSAADALFKSSRESYVRQAEGRKKIITPQKAVTPDDKPAWVEWGEISQDVQRRFRGSESFTLRIWPRSVLSEREQAAERILAAARAFVALWAPEETRGADPEFVRLRAEVQAGVKCGLYPAEVAR